jgi:hypothetical protein
MLSINKISKALEKKQVEISDLQNDNKKSFDLYNKYLNQIILERQTSEKFNEKLNNNIQNFIGAEATKELNSGLIKSNYAYLNSQDKVNKWKEDILKDRIIVAVDGSQVYSDKNIELFLGAIQIGWFINYHNKNLEAEKDFDFDFILPDKDLDNYELKELINTKRTEAEINKLIEIIKKLSKEKFIKKPLLFFDGSFTGSFEKSASKKAIYLNHIKNLLETSEKYKIPVVAYIDTSLAYNIINSLSLNFNENKKTKLSDAGLLKKFLNKWGDRSAFFKYKDSNNSNILENIAFSYIKNSSSKSTPSRIEIPTWILEDNLQDEIINIIMAESLIGNGYPYCIEVADSICVIQTKEKEVLYKFLNNNNILSFNLQNSNKNKSKSKRRSSKIRLK